MSMLTALSLLEGSLSLYLEVERRAQLLSNKERNALAAIPESAYKTVLTNSLLNLPPQARRRRINELKQAIRGIRRTVEQDISEPDTEESRKLILVATSARLINAMGERSLENLERFYQMLADGDEGQICVQAPGKSFGWPEITFTEPEASPGAEPDTPETQPSCPDTQ